MTKEKKIKERELEKLKTTRLSDSFTLSLRRREEKPRIWVWITM